MVDGNGSGDPKKSKPDDASNANKDMDGSPPDPPLALLITEILEQILNQLTSADLLGLRSVCSLWNTESTRSLIHQRLFRRNDQMQQFHLEMSRVQAALTSAERLSLIYDLNRNSKSPGLLLKNLRISTWHSHRDPLAPNPLLISDVPAIQTLLETFGQHVIQLKLDYCQNHLSVLNNLISIIGPTSYCPNVKTLYLDYRLRKDDQIDNSVPPPPAIDFGGNLHLQNLSFGINSSFPVAERIQIFRSIINSSPKLQRLSCITPYLEVLKSFSAVTENLRMLYISDNIHDSLQTLTELPFSSNLIRMQLYHYARKINKEEVDKGIEGWTAFCKTCGQSLTSLEVGEDGGVLLPTPEGTERIASIFLKGLQVMPALRELSLDPYLTQPLVENYDLLRKLPSLKVLVIGEICSLQKFLSNYINEPGVTPFIHTQLEEINYQFSGTYAQIVNHGTLQNLRTILPNLSTVLIKLPYPIEGSEFVRCFEEVSKMVNLKIFDVEMNGFDCKSKGNGSCFFIQGINCLKTSGSLQRLRFNFWRAYQLKENFQLFPFKELLVLLDAPKLRHIGITPHLIYETKKTQEFKDTVESFAQRDITLRFEAYNGEPFD